MKKIAHLSGRGRATPRLRRQAEILHGPGFAASIDTMVEDSVAVNALAALLDRAMAASTSTDGRLDLRDMASHVIREMRRNQR